MDLAAKLPDMETAKLAVLHDNAERLARTGTRAQQAAASELLPAIETELAARRAARAAEVTARREATKAAKGAPKPAAKRAASKRAAPKQGASAT